MGRTKNAMLRAVSALLVCRAALAMDVDVEDFGAKADNKTLSSVGINAALKAVAARGKSCAPTGTSTSLGCRSTTT